MDMAAIFLWEYWCKNRTFLFNYATLTLPLHTVVNFIPYMLRQSTGTLNISRTHGDSNPDLLEGQKGLLVCLQPFWPFDYFGHIWNFLVLFFGKSFDRVVSQPTMASALCTCNKTWRKCGENIWQEIVRTWNLGCTVARILLLSVKTLEGQTWRLKYLCR